MCKSLFSSVTLYFICTIALYLAAFGLIGAKLFSYGSHLQGNFQIYRNEFGDDQIRRCWIAARSLSIPTVIATVMIHFVTQNTFGVTW